jgi:hypothetical protein
MCKKFTYYLQSTIYTAQILLYTSYCMYILSGMIDTTYIVWNTRGCNYTRVQYEYVHVYISNEKVQQ